MYILAIETTGPFCSAALADENSIIDERSSDQTLKHLQSLTPMIEDILRKADLKVKDLSHIAVSAGPGSFTGIRIGVSTARGLAQMSGVKLVSVPTLYAFGCSTAARQGEGRIVCPIFDARRGQIYGGAYSSRQEIIAGGPYMLDEFLGKIPAEKGLLFTGDGLGSYCERIRSWAAENNVDVSFAEGTQRAGGVAVFAFRMLFDYEHFGDRTGLGYEELKPRYMRMAEAEKRLKEGTLSKKVTG